MSFPELMAFPDMVIVDRKAGESSGTTNILYGGDGSAYFGERYLWERIIGGPWYPIDLVPPRVISTPSGDTKRDGVFTKTLKPGRVYQVVKYHFDDINPNVDDPTIATRENRPDAMVTVVALLRDPEETNLIVAQDQNVGGTWLQKVVKTTTPTFFILQVSNAPSFRDVQGFERFFSPLQTIYDASAVNHNRLAEPLLPGNDLFYLVIVVDEFGNWQSISNQFRTKQRKVTINFDVLHIINDGALNDTTAEFHIWVMEGKNTVKDHFFGDIDTFRISDRPSKGHKDQEFIPLVLNNCPKFVIGPKDVSDATNDIGILTRGLIFRAVGSNEWAMNFFGAVDETKKNVPQKAMLPIPTGAGELVQNVPFVTRANSQVVDVEFEYDVTVLFTTEYI